VIQWAVERFRNRWRDEAKAVEIVRAMSQEARRSALADYDAFVPDAESAGDGLLLGTATSSAGDDIPIRLPWNDEYCHWLVQGGTGTGKTTWISSIIRQELMSARPVGVIDCKGDLFEKSVRWNAALAQNLDEDRRNRQLRRTVVVNPFSEALVPLNICRPLPGWTAEVQAYEMTLALSRLFDTSLGLHMENILRHLLILLGESGLSLVEAPLVLQDEVVRGLLAKKSSNPAVREFFLAAYPAVPKASKDALMNRLQGLLLPENIRLMLGADGLLDLRGVLDRGDPLFVFLGKGPGVPEEQVEVLGGLMLQLLFQATYARGSGRASPYLLAVDEFFHLLESPALAKRLETALTTTRSFGLSLMLINHNFAQLPTKLREIVLGNADLMALFRTSGQNAKFFGDFLPEIDPELMSQNSAGGDAKRDRRHQLETLQRLPNRHCYWYDRQKPHRALRLRVPDAVPPHEVVGMSVDRFEEVVRSQGWEQGGVAVPRSVLRKEIEARRERLRELVRPGVQVSRRAEPSSPKTKSSEQAKPSTKKRRTKLG
jgi:Type IV secretion-system coupling protein DNA-binding domain